MSPIELFIRRPVLATVVSLLILLLGAQGLKSVQIRQYPEIKETTVTITTAYVGASADLMQGFISNPIAKAVSSAEGVDYVTSLSRLGTSTVSVRMRLNTDPNAALTEVIAKVQQVRALLPPDALDPVVVKGTGQTFALMYLTFASTEMNPEEVSEYLTRVVQPRFATLQGVGSADILGGRDFSMRVWVDPVRLASLGVTATDVVSAINTSNFLAAPGKTQNEYVAYALQMQSTFQTPEAFGALPVRSDGDKVIRLRDVADVSLGPRSIDVRVAFNGKEGTFIGIVPAPSANPLDVAKEVTRSINEIKSTLPKGMSVEIVYDASSFISASIYEVFKTIGEAALIVVFVILLFLGSFRSVLIPIVTIPLSLVGVCFVLFVLGYSINLLTLLAMVLAIGLVVDDSIVVVENIHRHIEEGLSPVDAAIVGMKEIFVPIVSMTITLAAVYAPIGFVQGLTGSLFREFAFTLAGAVIISGIIAVTLSPMMSSRLLKPHGAGGQTGFAGAVDRYFTKIENWYARRLSGSLVYRWVTLAMVVMLLGTTAFLFMKTPSELAPEEDQGAYFGLALTPPYATVNYTAAFAEKVLTPFERIPEIDASFLISGINGDGGGFIGYKLKEWSERKRKGPAIKQDIQTMLNENPGIQAFVFAPPSLPGSSGGLPIQYVLRTTSDPAQAYEVAEQVKVKAMATGKFIVVQNSVTYQTPRARIVVDRDRAAALGVQVREIGNTINALVGNVLTARFDRDNRSYDVVTQVEQIDRLNPELLGSYYVRAANGTMVPLSALITVQTGASPAAIEQFNQLNSATISALPLPGLTTSEGLATLQKIAREIMPTGFYEDYAGQSRLEVQEGSSLLITFALAIIIIYLVLAAQFESFRDPFIIMMSVPLSVFGAMVFLNLGLATLNIYTQVGLITLVGLITKHGILLVEFANEFKHKHRVSNMQAIQEAARVRLRPILMTTAAMVLGVAPLIYASGAGAAARFSMGLVIAAGMSIGTIFTLVVVPMFYTFIARELPKEELDKGPIAEPTPAH